jgi:hypothetical protein
MQWLIPNDPFEHSNIEALVALLAVLLDEPLIQLQQEQVV